MFSLVEGVEEDIRNVGFHEGIEAGRLAGSQEGWELGIEAGRKLGLALSVMLTDTLEALDHSTVDRKGADKLRRLALDILDFPLDNQEDPEKEEKLCRLQARHKEICITYGVAPPINCTKNKDLSF